LSAASATPAGRASALRSLPSRLTGPAVVVVLLLLAVGPAVADEPTPLRRVTHALAWELGAAEIEPPLRGQAPTECVRAPHEPFLTRYSPLAPGLRAFHRRVTLAGGGPGRVELRDSLLIRAPRAFTWTVVPDAQPRLELSYYLFACAGSPRAPVRLRVTVEDLQGGRFEREELLEHRPPPTGSRFVDVVVDLPLPAGEPVRLTLELLSERGEQALALAEPTLSGVPAPEDPTGPGTNVLLIVIDAVRADVLGVARRPDLPSITPNLDRVVAAGTGFTAGYAVANQTRPSTLGMLVGQAPSIGGFHSRSWSLSEGRKRAFYERGPPLLTRALAEHGYRVVHIGHNHFLWDDAPIGFDHGFDRAVDLRAVPEDTPSTTEEAIRFLDRHAEDRWLLLLNYTAPHTPYDAPEPFTSEVLERLGPRPRDGVSRLYLAELAYVDHHIQGVFERLEALGLSERTLVIITADHGEVMHSAHACHSPRLQMRCEFNHGLTLYDEEIHVPLSFTLPGLVAAGHVVETPVSHVDLAPTVLSLLGLPPRVGHTGGSLVPALLGGDVAPRGIYAEGRYAAAMRTGDRKLIVHSREDDVQTRARGAPDARGQLPLLELFDLAADPFELDNLALTRGELTEPALEDLALLREDLHERARGERVVPEVAVAAAGGLDWSLGARAVNHLRLEPASTHEVVLKVTVPAGATLACGGAEGGDGGGVCERVSAEELTLRVLARDARAGVSFISEPWAAPMTIEATLDGDPFPVDRFRLGPLGLRLLGPGQALDRVAQLRLAAGRRGPQTVTGDLGVYLWRGLPGEDDPGAARPEAGATGEEDADRHMSEEVRGVLRSLGYTQ